MLAGLLMGIAVMAYLNARAFLGTTAAAPPHRSDAGDTMIFGSTKRPAPGDPIQALLQIPGQPLDHEPANLTPFPNAQLIHRFVRSTRGIGEAVSLHRLPEGTTLDRTAAHYRNAASDLGYRPLGDTAETNPASDRVSLRFHDAGNGRVLIIRIAPRVDGGPLHATVWLRYAMEPQTSQPQRSVSP